MKAIKINAEAMCLEVVTIENYKDIYAHIGDNCRTFAVPVVLDNNDGIYIDDEGLYNDYTMGFMFKDWAYPIVGNGLICGADDMGESIDAQSKLEDIAKKLFWVKLK